MLVFGAGDDTSRVEGDAGAVAKLYGAQVEIVPGVGHVMMLEPGWITVAERLNTWLGSIA